jgi:hypothetical protein
MTLGWNGCYSGYCGCFECNFPAITRKAQKLKESTNMKVHKLAKMILQGYLPAICEWQVKIQGHV